MRKMHRWTWILSLFLLPFAGGCEGGGNDGQANLPPPAGGRSSPEIKEIMTKLAKGPNSLTPVLGNELKADQPAWETIQGQTKEYAQLAGELVKYDPPKGSKESWTKLTGEYSAAASELDKAAQAKDKDAALQAHGQVANSCMSCHRQHRTMGPGPGGPRGKMGPPGFGPGGPGGPPPGGPGGPPPGGFGPGGPPPGGFGPGGPPPGGPAALAALPPVVLVALLMVLPPVAMRRSDNEAHSRGWAEIGSRPAREDQHAEDGPGRSGEAHTLSSSHASA